MLILGGCFVPILYLVLQRLFVAVEDGGYGHVHQTEAFGNSQMDSPLPSPTRPASPTGTRAERPITRVPADDFAGGLEP